MKTTSTAVLTFVLMLVSLPTSLSAQTDGYYEGIMWILLNNPGKGDEAIQRTFNYSISKQEAKSIMADTVQHYVQKGEEIRRQEEWLDTDVKISTSIANSKFINVGKKYRLIVTDTFQYDEGEKGTRADAQHEQNDDLQFTGRHFLAINGQLLDANKSTNEQLFNSSH